MKTRLSKPISEETKLKSREYKMKTPDFSKKYPNSEANTQDSASAASEELKKNI